MYIVIVVTLVFFLHLFQGQYFQKGDIVSVTDVGGGIFYAQLRGFLTDQYCEKSAVITWLLPTTNSPPPDEVSPSHQHSVKLGKICTQGLRLGWVCFVCSTVCHILLGQVETRQNCT